MSAATRQYTVKAVLGEGGFGRVYRATLESSGGFSKDVAVKIARGDIPEDALRRLRDEARILGLVRDRAIVSVDPPTQLAGRWAVVMEYVEGATCRQLLRDGVFPARVVIEIVAEVARALDKSYRQLGPKGLPLQLLHRDLKPGNIQITPSGEVKILDFGIARAAFEERESRTTRHIGGTIGYIAPERLDGVEGPEGDVFSLGVTLHKLVCGRMPLRRERLNPAQVGGDGDAAEAAVLALSARMRDPDPSARPTARDVEDACRTAWSRMGGPTLRMWAEQRVPRSPEIPEDGRVGQVLVDVSVDTSAVAPRRQASAGSVSRRRSSSTLYRAVLAGLVGFMLVLAGVFATVGVVAFLIGLGVWWSGPQPATSGRQAANPQLRTPVPQPPPPAPEVEPVVPPAPPLPARSPAVQAPAPSTELAVVTWPVTISSVPLGAEVYLDGDPLGVTPVVNHGIAEGRHSLELRLGGDGATYDIRVGARRPRRYVWRDGETLEMHH